MVRWFMVRHGETDWNIEGRAQGQTDTPLNEKGHAQAKMLGSRLAGVEFAAAYASDLTRVMETAKPIVAGRAVELQTMPELREKRYGQLEGMSFKEVEAQYPDVFKQLFDEDIDFAPPEGESDSDVYRRVGSATETLKSAHDGDSNVLIVAHGGSLRAMMVSVLNMPAEYMWRFKLANGSLSVVSLYKCGGVTLDLLNDTSHLGDTFG
ncbi:MAG: histidine phosphatase family protein [Chloroflexi bacterium]|nr:histidine phosphatase family protein [Chloroflexota bacterium]MDA1228072.1 histidine phosphatase family protein [Chloroflexota bacterium]